MIEIIMGIGCIVAVLILMVPPVLFGYFLNETINGCGDEGTMRFVTTLCVIEFVTLAIALVLYVKNYI
jgi:hypothetical protein